MWKIWNKHVGDEKWVDDELCVRGLVCLKFLLFVAYGLIKKVCLEG